MYNLLANKTGKSKKSNQGNTKFRNKIICNTNCVHAISREGNPCQLVDSVNYMDTLWGYMGGY